MIYSLLSFVLQAPFALAAGLPTPTVKPPTQVGVVQNGPNGLVCLGLKWLFTAAIIVSVAFVLIAAYEYLTSAGDPAKVKKATNRIIYVAIGVAVAILARSVPVLVGNLVGAGPDSTNTSSICP